MCDVGLLPIVQGEVRPARQIIDRAAVVVVGVDEAEIAEW